MRRYTCGTCTGTVPFDADRCARCGSRLGYFPDHRDIHTIHPAHGPDYHIAGDDGMFLRCLNHAWGCNWMLPQHTGDVWCVSCRLTRGRPDTTNPDAVDAWSSAESTKRRLVDQLIALDLPLGRASGGHPLVFDLLYLPDGAGATGHRNGVVTLDLRETDDSYRDALRRQLVEPFRTVIGHLRHEIGHHYWPTLVPDSAVEDFRALFGDERVDYAAALTAHYQSVPRQAFGSQYISSYAAAHPSEDWAETFAHYLHISDGLETAAEQGLTTPLRADDDAGVMLRSWQHLTDAVNHFNVGLGQPPAYPFRLGHLVRDKLAFIHNRLRRTSRHNAPTTYEG